ncbi:conserved oligomeric Golgi complex component [Dinochytrium kinnereticum]|nr:conserved oligomeric Golgi complex component [Dinochytrium kinnereticum]
MELPPLPVTANHPNGAHRTAPNLHHPHDALPSPLHRKSSGGHLSSTRGHDLLISMLVTSATPVSASSKVVTSPTSAISHEAGTPKERRGSIGRFSLDAHGSSLTRKEAGVIASNSLSWSLFRDHEYLNYLDQLTSCSLETLIRQPRELAEDAERIDAQLADLAYTEHRSFLNANACSRSIRSTFDGLDARIEAVSTSLASLEASCRQFEASTASIMADRKRMGVVVNQQSRLLDVLEIPQLIDTFIRNGYYEEAMELQVHVGRLLMRHPEIPILKQISEDVQTAMHLMLTQLVSLLRGSSKLPMSIRVIGYLRRMEAFPEPELRLVFLKQKDAYLTGLIRELGDSVGVDYMKKYTEILREHLFDIITQYKTIFSDSSLSTSGATPHSSSSIPSFSSLSYGSKPSSLMMPESTPYATSAILSSYAVFRVTEFAGELKRHIATVSDANSINSLLTQTMYFGLSLGRVGVDFRDVVADIFESAIEKNFEALLSEGVQQFARWAAMTDGTGVLLKNSLAMYRDFDVATPRTSLSSMAPPTATTASIVAPPTVLLSQPHLARLLNAFFGAYNQLRVVAPTSLFRKISGHVATSLLTSAESLLQTGQRLFPEVAAGVKRHAPAPPLPTSPLSPIASSKELEDGGSSEADSRLPEFRETCQAFVDVVVPAVLDGVLHHIYGSISANEERPPVILFRDREVVVRVKDVQAACRSLLVRFLPVVGRSGGGRRRSSVMPGAVSAAVDDAGEILKKEDLEDEKGARVDAADEITKGEEIEEQNETGDSAEAETHKADQNLVGENGAIVAEAIETAVVTEEPVAEVESKAEEP